MPIKTNIPRWLRAIASLNRRRPFISPKSGHGAPAFLGPAKGRFTVCTQTSEPPSGYYQGRVSDRLFRPDSNDCIKLAKDPIQWKSRMVIRGGGEASLTRDVTVERWRRKDLLTRDGATSEPSQCCFAGAKTPRDSALNLNNNKRILKRERWLRKRPQFSVCTLPCEPNKDSQSIFATTILYPYL